MADEPLSLASSGSLDARIKIPPSAPVRFAKRYRHRRVSSSLSGSLSERRLLPTTFPPRDYAAMIAIVAPMTTNANVPPGRRRPRRRRSFPRVFTGGGGKGEGKIERQIAIDAIALCKRALPPPCFDILLSKRGEISSLLSPPRLNARFLRWE